MNAAPLLNKIKFEDLDYNLQISIENNKIIISLKSIDSEIRFFYKYESNLEELRKLNIIFSVFDSLEEIKDFLIEFTSIKENIKIIENKTINDDEE